MPSDYHGFGTIYQGYAAAVNWRPNAPISSRADHDAVLCYTALYLPIVPIETVHTWDWTGDMCRTLRLRSTGRLLLRAYLRGPLNVILAVGAVALMIAALFLGSDWYATGHIPSLARLGWPTVLSFFAVEGAAFSLVWSLARLDRRDRDIRLVLGPHEYGSSDPAMWREETLSMLRPSVELLGEEDEIEAGHTALRVGDYGRAMYAARLAVARRGIEGEVLTEEILAHPDVRALLREIRRRPWRRAELLPTTMRPSAVPRPLEENRRTTCHRDGKEIGPDDGATFYDGLAYCDECLNAAGGEGFADAVRREPILVRRVPNGAVMTGFLLCLMGGAAWWAWSQAFDAGVRDREAGVVTAGLIALAFGYVSFSGRRRRARIEGMRLLVEGSGALMLHQIREVRRTSWLIHSPIYRALGCATEMVQWPRHGPGSEAIARAALAAIELRKPAAPSA